MIGAYCKPVDASFQFIISYTDLQYLNEAIYRFFFIIQHFIFALRCNAQV